MKSNESGVMCSFLAVLLTGSALLAESSHVASWIGNSGSAAPTGKTGTFTDLKGAQNKYKCRDYVQMDAKAAWVTPQGAVIATTWFEEGHQEVTIYQDGKIFPLPDMHYRTGLSVTADDEFIYLDWIKTVQRHKKFSNMIRRCRLSDQSEVDETLVSEYEGDQKRIMGMVAQGGKLFVSDPSAEGVRVLNTGDMKEIARFPVEKARKLAIDKTGVLWIVQGGEGSSATNPGRGAKVLRYSATGEKLPGEITDVLVPTAIAIDNQGRVLVADSDPKRNHVRIYTPGGKPALAGTFGRSLYEGKVGEMQPDKFDHITGVGTDAMGNWYVVWNGGPFDGEGRVVSDAQGTVIRSLTPDGKLRWECLGLHFIDCADADPADENQVYAKTEHYVMDYSKPAGKQWTLKGWTLDKTRYPDDPRLNCSHTYTSQMLRIGGKLFMATADQYKNYTTLYRFDGETAVPCVMFSTNNRGEYPSQRPKLGKGISYLWRDGAGGALDGNFQAGEFVTFPSGWAGCSYFDKKGNLWRAFSKDKIQKWTCGGLDGNGVPIYSPQTMEVLDVPAEMPKATRLEYDSDRDSMYLLGFTKETPEGGSSGAEVIRYDNWSIKPTLRSRMFLPNGKGPEDITVAFSVADEYVFIGQRKGQPVTVFDSRTGQSLEKLVPGEAMGGPEWYGGGLDCPQSVRAYKRSNGEILIFTEEVSYAKVLMHQWTPSVKK